MEVVLKSMDGMVVTVMTILMFMEIYKGGPGPQTRLTRALPIYLLCLIYSGK